MIKMLKAVFCKIAHPKFHSAAYVFSKNFADHVPENIFF